MKIYIAKKDALPLVRKGDKFVIYPLLTNDYKEKCKNTKQSVYDIEDDAPYLIPINSDNGLGIAYGLIPDFEEWFDVVDDSQLGYINVPFINGEMQRIVDEIETRKIELDELEEKYRQLSYM